jgi:hypothetical protein
VSLVIIVASLVFLMYVAYRGYSVILFAPVAALGAVLLTDPSLVAPMFTGDTASPCNVIGPPHPTPQTPGGASPRSAPTCRTPLTTDSSATNRPSASAPGGVGTWE